MVTFWFSTFVMIYSTAMSLVWFKNTRRWMLRSLKKAYTYFLTVWWLSGLVLSQPTQRWMVHCYEGLFITLQLRDFGIIIILCVCAISMMWIVHAMPQTRGVSPFSQAGFGMFCFAALRIRISTRNMSTYYTHDVGIQNSKK